MILGGAGALPGLERHPVQRLEVVFQLGREGTECPAEAEGTLCETGSSEGSTDAGF
jgi:hypothetical protein